MSIIEGQESSENSEESQEIEQTDDQAFLQLEMEDWIKDFPTRTAPDHNPRYQFQREQCGEQEIQVKGGGQEIWADGVDVEKGELLEAKYIENPANSPYISSSKCPPFIRNNAVGEVENEFRRYEAVINDPETPVQSLQVIVNMEEAVPFFTDLLDKFNVPCSVVVKS